MCNMDNVEKTISLMQAMSRVDQEKLVCVAQGMVLAQTATDDKPA